MKREISKNIDEFREHEGKSMFWKKKSGKKKGNVYLLTGNGWGKTTSALGVCLRAVGHGKKAIVVQFMKGRNYIGEYKVMKRLAPNYYIYQFGREEFVNLKNPSLRDHILAKKGIEFAKKAVKKEKPFLIVLDEVNIAARIGLLDKKEVLDFVDSIPASVNVYMTGRYAPLEFKKRADYVTYVKAVKHPKLDLRKAKLGIDY